MDTKSAIEVFSSLKMREVIGIAGICYDGLDFNELIDQDFEEGAAKLVEYAADGGDNIDHNDAVVFFRTAVWISQAAGSESIN